MELLLILKEHLEQLLRLIVFCSGRQLGALKHKPAAKRPLREKASLQISVLGGDKDKTVVLLALVDLPKGLLELLFVHGEHKAERITALKLLLRNQREVNRSKVATISGVVVSRRREKGGAVVARLVFALVATAIMRLGIAVVAYFVASDDCVSAERHTFSVDELALGVRSAVVAERSVLVRADIALRRAAGQVAVSRVYL